MELINKDLLKEELNTRIEVLSIPGFSDNPLMVGERSAYLSILSFLDTIEVKEVNLDRAIDKWIDDAAITHEDCSITDVISTAKHFFELGLKVKGE